MEGLSTRRLAVAMKKVFVWFEGNEEWRAREQARLVCVHLEERHDGWPTSEALDHHRESG